MRVSFCLAIVLCFSNGSVRAEVEADQPSLMSAGDLATLTAPEPDYRIGYGDDSLQFANLRLPQGEGPHPVIAFIHGGCWLSMFDISHAAALEQALADVGFAVWSIEYRRVGDDGGGWPGTYRDIGAGLDKLRGVAEEHALDLDRLIVSGHSAGAALALWAAARSQMPVDSDLYTEDPLSIDHVVALAPAADLEGVQMTGACDDVIGKLMGGPEEAQPDRYAIASPMDLAPIDVPQTLLVGAHDTHWKPAGMVYYWRAVAVGDQHVTLIELPDSGHFEMINPGSTTWPRVVAAFRKAIRK